MYIFYFDLKLSEQSLYNVKRLPSFYKDLVLLWENYSYLLVQSEVNKKTVLSQAIFNNKNLLIKGESIWHKHLHSQGMRIICDLHDNEGAIKTWNVLSAEYHLGPESFLSCYSWLRQSLRGGRPFSELLLLQMEIWHLKMRITDFIDVSVLNWFIKS